MNRPGPWFLLWVALSLLLAAQPQAAGAAIPPLKWVEASVYQQGVYSQVIFKVWDPSRQEYRYGESRYFGISPSLNPNSILIQDGIVAWVGTYPSFRFVECAIYDPGPGQWKIYTSSSDVYSGYAYGLTIQNGVVSWTGPTTSTYPTETYVSVATYDPQRSAWRTRSAICSGAFPNLQNKDGIIAYQSLPSSQVDFIIYDPEYPSSENGKLNKGAYISGNYYSGNINITSFSIENYSVKIVAGNTTIYRGYSHNSGQWDIQGSSLPLASFLPQPAAGKPPLWVGFWDQSLGPDLGLDLRRRPGGL